MRDNLPTSIRYLNDDELDLPHGGFMPAITLAGLAAAAGEAAVAAAVAAPVSTVAVVALVAIGVGYAAYEMTR